MQEREANTEFEDKYMVLWEGSSPTLYYKCNSELLFNYTGSLKTAWETDIRIAFREKEWVSILHNLKYMSRDIHNKFKTTFKNVLNTL